MAETGVLPQAGPSWDEAGKNFISATVGKHPRRAAIALGVVTAGMVAAIIAAFYWHEKWKEAHGKGKFGGRSYGVGSVAAHAGSADAGHGGPVHREYTPHQDQHQTLEGHAELLTGAGGNPGCREEWDALAISEAQALSAVGGSTNARAIDDTTLKSLQVHSDRDHGFTDAQLADVMTGGEGSTA